MQKIVTDYVAFSVLGEATVVFLTVGNIGGRKYMKALVLSGGGAKGAYELGVLKRWMSEEKCDYDIMTGVSVGALNVAALGMVEKGSPEKAVEYLENFWLNVNTPSVWKRWFPFGMLSVLWKKSAYNSNPLINLVKQNVNQKVVAGNKRIISVGACSLSTGENVYARENNPYFVDYVLASSSFPVFLTPIEINGQLYTDGGVRNVTPLGEAIKLGATDIDIVTCQGDEISGWDHNGKKGVPDVMFRALDIMSNQITRSDLRLCGLKNELAITNSKYKVVTVRMVCPAKGVELVKNSLKFNRDEITRMIEMGYEDAIRNSEFVYYK